MSDHPDVIFQRHVDAHQAYDRLSHNFGQPVPYEDAKALALAWMDQCGRESELVVQVRELQEALQDLSERRPEATNRAVEARRQFNRLFPARDVHLCNQMTSLRKLYALHETAHRSPEPPVEDQGSDPQVGRVP